MSLRRSVALPLLAITLGSCRDPMFMPATGVAVRVGGAAPDRLQLDFTLPPGA